MRGYQKKVIFLKNAGGEIFDEAYFVLKCDDRARVFSHATMVSEAKRIIEENFGLRKRKFKFINLPMLFSFLSGSLITLFLVFLFL